MHRRIQDHIYVQSKKSSILRFTNYLVAYLDRNKNWGEEKCPVFSAGHGAGHGDDHGDDHGDGHGDDHGDSHGDDHSDGHGDDHKDDHGDDHKDSHGDDHKDSHGSHKVTLFKVVSSQLNYE